MTIKKQNFFFMSILGCSIFYLLVLQPEAIWRFTIDDMYITLRYARNWAEGNGLVWNVGEASVEGYSNFTYVVLGYLAIKLGLSPVLMLKSVGFVALCFVNIAIYLISRFWFIACLAVIPCLWLLAYQGQIIWSVSGLETTLYEALICFSIFFVIKGLGYRNVSFPVKSKNQDINLTSAVEFIYKRQYVSGSRDDATSEFKIIPFVLAGVLLAVAGMTRPEAPVFIGLIFAVLLSKRPFPKVCLVTFIAVFIICYSPYFLWRWNYYGRLFPNPVYCKGFNSNEHFVLIVQYWKLVWPFMLLALPVCCRSINMLLLMPSIIYTVLLVGSDPIVAFDNRLFLTPFVLLLPLALQGIYTILNKTLQKRDETLLIAMYIIAGLIMFFCIPMKSLQDYRHFAENPIKGEMLRRNVVDWIYIHTNENTRIVLGDCGLIPYLSSRRFTDSYCLNNIEMTKFQKKNMYLSFCQQTIHTKPEVIILTSLIEKGKSIYTPSDSCLSNYLTQKRDYKLQLSLSTGNQESSYRYEIYQRF